MSICEDALVRAPFSSSDLRRAPLGTRILMNRLRFEMRASPGTQAAKPAEPTGQLAENPSAASEPASA